MKRPERPSATCSQPRHGHSDPPAGNVVHPKARLRKGDAGNSAPGPGRRVTLRRARVDARTREAPSTAHFRRRRFPRPWRLILALPPRTAESQCSGLLPRALSALASNRARQHQVHRPVPKAESPPKRLPRCRAVGRRALRCLGAQHRHRGRLLEPPPSWLLGPGRGAPRKAPPRRQRSGRAAAVPQDEASPLGASSAPRRGQRVPSQPPAPAAAVPQHARRVPTPRLPPESLPQRSCDAPPCGTAPGTAAAAASRPRGAPAPLNQSSAPWRQYI